jgi:hypothetical protein
MRRSVVFVGALLVGTLFLGTQPAFALTRTIESPPPPPIQGQRIEGTCSFPVTVDQRDTRTKITWTDRRGSIVLQTFATRTTTLFTKLSKEDPLIHELEMPLDERTIVSVTPNADGSGTIVFAGDGAIWGTDTGLGTPFLLWVTGVVPMKGFYDDKTGILTVSSKTIFGLSTDLCESLTTGLKPRHDRF